MTQPISLFRMQCIHCGHDEWTDVGGAVMRLRSVGHLKRGAPDAEMVLALAPSAQGQLTCGACGALGIRITASVDRPDSRPTADDDASLWPAEIRHCEQCRKPIPPERLEVYPTSRVCAICQGAREQGGGACDYCPKCGDILSLSHTSRGGVTRYEQRCHACGYRD